MSTAYVQVAPGWIRARLPEPEKPLSRFEHLCLEAHQYYGVTGDLLGYKNGEIYELNGDGVRCLVGGSAKWPTHDMIMHAWDIYQRRVRIRNKWINKYKNLPNDATMMIPVEDYHILEGNNNETV